MRVKADASTRPSRSPGDQELVRLVRVGIRLTDTQDSLRDPDRSWRLSSKHDCLVRRIARPATDAFAERWAAGLFALTTDMRG